MVQVREIFSSGESRYLFLKPSRLPLSYSQRSSKALPVSMQKLAWDAGTRRWMLSDPKVLSCDPTCKAVHANLCTGAWGGPKCKNILLVLQGKAHQHTQPSLQLCANSWGRRRDRGLHDGD